MDVNMLSSHQCSRAYRDTVYSLAYQGCYFVFGDCFPVHNDKRRDHALHVPISVPVRPSNVRLPCFTVRVPPFGAKACCLVTRWTSGALLELTIFECTHVSRGINSAADVHPLPSWKEVVYLGVG